MDAFHPWTKYEIARLRDEERVLRARDAMHVRELRGSRRHDDATARAASWFDRLRRRQPAESEATRGRPRPV